MYAMSEQLPHIEKLPRYSNISATPVTRVIRIGLSNCSDNAFWADEQKLEPSIIVLPKI